MSIDIPLQGPNKQSFSQDHDIHIFSVGPQANMAYEDFGYLCEHPLPSS